MTFQSSFELTGYITAQFGSKTLVLGKEFQSSFELTGYITAQFGSKTLVLGKEFQSSFELTGYITLFNSFHWSATFLFQSSFELTGYITMFLVMMDMLYVSFKALSSLRVI